MYVTILRQTHRRTDSTTPSKRRRGETCCSTAVLGSAIVVHPKPQPVQSAPKTQKLSPVGLPLRGKKHDSRRRALYKSTRQRTVYMTCIPTYLHAYMTSHRMLHRPPSTIQKLDNLFLIKKFNHLFDVRYVH